MYEHAFARSHDKSGKPAPATGPGNSKPIVVWGTTMLPVQELSRTGLSTEQAIHGIVSEPTCKVLFTQDLHWQVRDNVPATVVLHDKGLYAGSHGDCWYEDCMRMLAMHPQGQQPVTYGDDSFLVQRRGLPASESDEIAGRKGILHHSNLPAHEPRLSFSAHQFMRVLRLFRRQQPALDLFGQPAPAASPTTAPAQPEPTVADQLAVLLAKLQDSSKKKQEFDEKVVADIDALLDDQPAARTALLNVARGEPAPGNKLAWAPRVRWFALEQLRHWPLPETDAMEFLPAPGYLETLIEAVELWDEDEALYGAVVNARLVKVNIAQRANLREALIERLSGKIDSLERTMSVFEAQLLGQVLCTFGSFANSEDLELLGRFALADSAFAVRTHALEALRRVACREPDASATDAFFDAHKGRFVDLCNSCLQLRRSSEPAGTLLWSAVGVLLGRFGSEAMIVADLAQAHAKLRRDISLEIDRAAEYLERIGQAKRLEAQTAVRHRLADSVGRSALVP